MVIHLKGVISVIYVHKLYYVHICNPKNTRQHSALINIILITGEKEVSLLGS